LEHTLDLERAKLFGVNPEELVLVENADNAEQAMDIVIKLAKEKAVDLIIVDSIQAMTPKEENVEGKGEKTRSMEEQEIAALAKKMGKFLRRTSSVIYKGKCSVILIGQARTGGIGTFITRDELTGGRAIKFWSMLTVYLRKGQSADAPVEKIKTGKLTEKGKEEMENKKVGFDCVLVIQKTKKGNSKPELSELHLPYYFSKGILNEKI
jgi:RecA/RadA recombinase